MSTRRKWDLTTPIPVQTTTKNKSKKDIVFPIFEKVNEYVTDPFWKNIFNKAACGKMEKGFSYKNGIFAHKKGSKCVNIVLSEDIPQALIEIKTFMQTNANVISPQDLEMETIVCNNINEKHWSTDTNSLSDIKHEKFKQLLIYLFIEEEGKKNNFTTREKIMLREVLSFGKLVGHITNGDFIIENGRITRVNKLLFDSHTKTYSIQNSGIKKQKVEKVCMENEDYFYSKWNKMMKSFYEGHRKTGAKAIYASKLKINKSSTNVEIKLIV